MKIAATETTPVGLIFHKESTRDGLFLYWDNETRRFYTGTNQVPKAYRQVENEKYARAENAAEAKKLAAEFFAELGEDDE